MCLGLLVLCRQRLRQPQSNGSHYGWTTGYGNVLTKQRKQAVVSVSGAYRDGAKGGNCKTLLLRKDFQPQGLATEYLLVWAPPNTCAFVLSTVPVFFQAFQACGSAQQEAATTQRRQHVPLTVGLH
jgi:hypothetical protein